MDFPSLRRALLLLLAGATAPSVYASPALSSADTADASSVAFAGCLGYCIKENDCDNSDMTCICKASANTGFLGTVIECMAKNCQLGTSDESVGEIVSYIDETVIEVIQNTCLEDNVEIPSSRVKSAIKTASSAVAELFPSATGTATTSTKTKATSSTPTPTTTTSSTSSTSTTKSRSTSTSTSTTASSATQGSTATQATATSSASSSSAAPESTSTPAVVVSSSLSPVSSATSVAVVSSSPAAESTATTSVAPLTTETTTESPSSTSTKTTSSSKSATSGADSSKDTVDSSPFTTNNDSAGVRNGPTGWHAMLAAALPIAVVFGMRLV